jgi:hypothetical protein
MPQITSGTLSDTKWKFLARCVLDGLVVPIIGPALATVRDGGRDIPLKDWIPPKLADRLGLDDSESYCSLNEIVLEFCDQNLSNMDELVRELQDLTEEASVKPPESLVKLASIPGFDLFIAATPDPLLARAIQQARHGARAEDLRHSFSVWAGPKLFPYPPPNPSVFHIFGHIQDFPRCAILDEDYLEFLCKLMKCRREEALGNLFRVLKERYLLLLGAPHEDWFWRFFLRVARDEQTLAIHSEVKEATLATPAAALDPKTAKFFEKLATNVRIVQDDPAQFISELARWVEKERVARAELFRKGFPSTPANNHVFLSYSHQDKDLAIRIAQTLAKENIPVWMDQHRLEAGDPFDEIIQNAIRHTSSFFLSLVTTQTEDDEKREHYVHKERDLAAQRVGDSRYPYYLLIVADGIQDPKKEPNYENTRHYRTYLDPNGELKPRFVENLKDMLRSVVRDETPKFQSEGE